MIKSENKEMCWKRRLILGCFPLSLSWVSLQHAHALELLKDQLVEGAKALDVGSGSGYLTACFARMVSSWHSIPNLQSTSLN